LEKGRIFWDFPVKLGIPRAGKGLAICRDYFQGNWDAELGISRFRDFFVVETFPLFAVSGKGKVSFEEGTASYYRFLGRGIKRKDPFQATSQGTLGQF